MRNAVVVTLILGVAQGLLAQSNVSSQSFSKAHAEYLSLNRQIFVRYEDPESQRTHVSDSGQVAVIGARLHNILREAIQSVLASSRPTASDVKSAVNTVQGELAFSTFDGDNLPFAEFFQVGASENMVVAYAVLEGGEAIPESKAYIEFYNHASGTWEPQAATGSDFDGSTLSVASVASGARDEKWLLAWGTRAGDNASRLNLRLYGYNGTSVRTVWKRDGLVGGAIQVSPTAISLEYDKEYHSAERVHEALHVTASGLE